jgi:hypothetical protein
MDKVYLYDEDGNYTGYKEVYSDYQPQQWETFLKPDPTLYRPKFDGAKWTGVTHEEYDTARQIATPNPEQIMIMKQQAQLAQLTEQSKQLQQLAMKQQMQIAQLQQNNK